MSLQDFFSDLNVKTANPADLTALKIMIYGPPGAGKTSLAGSASHVEELSPVLYIDLERGTAPLVRHADNDNLLVVQPTSFLEFKKVLDRVVKKDGKAPFKTVVIDTVDRLQKLVVDHWANDKSQYEKWTQAFEQIFTMINRLSFDNDFTLICLTHEEAEVLATTGERVIAPKFEGKKSNSNLPAIFDIVGRLTLEELDDQQLVRVLTVRTADGIVSKSRFDTLPDMIGNPTMAKLQGYFNEYVNSLDNTTPTN